MRKSAFFFAILTLVASLAGCRPEEGIKGGVPAERTYTSAVSLSPSATEILATRLYQVALMGRTASCNFPVNLTAEVVMKETKPNYERLAELRPGIIVYDEGLFSEADEAKLKELGSATYAISGNTLREFEESLYRLGALVGGETSISEYIDLIHAAKNAAEGSPPAKTLKVAVVIPGKGSEHMIAGTGSFVADVVRASQGDPVGPDAEQFVPLNAESLLALNPDVIVSAGLSGPLKNDPRLQSLKPVQTKGRILEADPDIVLRRGSRVDKLIRGLYGFFERVAREP